MPFEPANVAKPAGGDKGCRGPQTTHFCPSVSGPLYGAHECIGQHHQLVSTDPSPMYLQPAATGPAAGQPMTSTSEPAHDSFGTIAQPAGMLTATGAPPPAPLLAPLDVEDDVAELELATDTTEDADTVAAPPCPLDASAELATPTAAVAPPEPATVAMACSGVTSPLPPQATRRTVERASRAMDFMKALYAPNPPQSPRGAFGQQWPVVGQITILLALARSCPVLRCHGAH